MAWNWMGIVVRLRVGVRVRVRVRGRVRSWATLGHIDPTRIALLGVGLGLGLV